MAKCRYCGSEDHLFSEGCPFLRDVHTEGLSSSGRKRRFALPVIPIILVLLLGLALISAGITENRENLASLGLFIVSAGIGLIVCSLTGIRRPLWMVREGKRSRNRTAVALMSFGIMTITYELGYLALSAILDKPAGSGMAHSIALFITILVVVAGYLERPASVFGAGKQRLTTRRMRVTIGVSLLLAGVLTLVVTRAYLSSQGTDPYSGVALMSWAMLFGFVLGAGGLGMIFPSGRWWVSRGVLKES